ncbi:MAG: Flp pilus assembly complex ATPase component TadA [Armatimonadetes bacterium]|nr:Flp pilus assembly complex ATPase component TadA [Armatimonadota bacterium]
MMELTKRLGDILLDAGAITKEQLEGALQEQKGTKERLGKVLIRLGYLTEMDIARALEAQLFIPFQDVSKQNIDPKVVALLPKELIEQENVLPISLNGSRLQVAVVDPLNPIILDTIRRITNYEIDPVITTESSIQQALELSYSAKYTAQRALADMKQEINTRKKDTDERTQVIAIDSKARDSAHAIIRLVESILSQAIMDRASDIHLEPQSGQVRVRYRVDGVLYPLMAVPKELQSDVITRLKVVSGMDITESRLPQDGHYTVKMGAKEYDLRIATMPGAFGEKMVIRLLDKQGSLIGLDKIDFSPENLAGLKRLISRPYGILLVTGPTGSGKTTTLYSILSELNKDTTNILTIEDPIEYQFETITQMQVNPKIDLTFASGLRASLRQDPDIILVGEIRDKETLEIAVQASMTGHLVFSTMHTNDALSSIARMQEMGVNLSFIMTGLNAIIAQRLVRRLCPKCREPEEMTSADLKKQGFNVEDGQTFTLYKAGPGCDTCNRRSYAGRMGVHEVLVLEDQISELILRGEPLSVVRYNLIRKGMRFLADDGLAKALQGMTSLEELERVVNV